MTMDGVQQFDAVAARRLLHADFDAIEKALREALSIAKVTKSRTDQEIRDSLFTHSVPWTQLGPFIRELEQHLRNLDYWREDYPADGSNT